MTDNQQISALHNLYLSRETIRSPWTYLPQIMGRCETPATYSHTQQDSLCVECASWLLLIPFSVGANYIFLRSSHIFLLSSSSLIPQQQIMATETPQHCEGGSESSRLTGASCIAALAGRQQKRSCQLVHREAANGTTKYMTLEAHLKIIHTSESSMQVDVSISISR